MKNARLLFILLFVAWTGFYPAAASQETKTVIDSNGRKVKIPDRVEHIICSGPGALRLITYFHAQHMVVAVDDIETRNRIFDARPYALANPQFKKLPVFGGFRGQDDPEKILGLPVLPQVIFKTYPTMGYDPVELEQKTGIPVVVLDYGNLSAQRKNFFKTIRIIGTVLQKEKRAEALIAFFQNHIRELDRRTEQVSSRKTCFVGGIAFKGPHGFQSTEPFYPPFQFVNARNIASVSKISGQQMAHSNFSKEKLLEQDPDVLFLDLSTLQMGNRHGGLFELRHDPVYRAMTAVKSGRVYGVLPYNWYTGNFGSTLANAWYVGKILYPEQFAEILPEKKADEIYKFLLSARVYTGMNRLFSNMAFRPIPLASE